MAGVTGIKSPLHEQACVAFSTILGGAVVGIGTGGTATPLGFVAGFVIGVLICSRDVISKPIKSRLDFESALDQVSNDAATQEKIIDKMAAYRIGATREQSAAILRLIVADARKNPNAYFHKIESKGGAPVAHIDFVNAHAASMPRST